MRCIFPRLDHSELDRLVSPSLGVSYQNITKRWIDGGATNSTGVVIRERKGEVTSAEYSIAVC